MNKPQELEAARNLEPDCDYGAVGAGRYRALNEQHLREMNMKAQHWAVTARYAPSGSRPGNRRHPTPEDFRRRTIVGLAAVSTVEAVLDLLEVPEDVRRAIRVQDVVRSFVKGNLVPDQPYPHHAVGMRYVSADPEAQLVEWSIEFAFVTKLIGGQDTGGLSSSEGRESRTMRVP